MADAVQGMQQGVGEPSLTDLIERSAELKGQLVAFAQSTRFDRWLTPLLLEAAGPERQLVTVHTAAAAAQYCPSSAHAAFPKVSA